MSRECHIHTPSSSFNFFAGFLANQNQGSLIFSWQPKIGNLMTFLFLLSIAQRNQVLEVLIYKYSSSHIKCIMKVFCALDWVFNLNSGGMGIHPTQT